MRGVHADSIGHPSRRAFGAPHDEVSDWANPAAPGSFAPVVGVVGLANPLISKSNFRGTSLAMAFVDFVRAHARLRSDGGTYGYFRRSHHGGDRAWRAVVRAGKHLGQHREFADDRLQAGGHELPRSHPGQSAIEATRWHGRRLG